MAFAAAGPPPPPPPPLSPRDGGSGGPGRSRGQRNTQGDSPENTCPECAKTFQSRKALYGHMRTHRDRGYKGMVRPPEGTFGREREVATSLLLLSVGGGEDRRTICGDCGRVFETPQALGGHRASHRSVPGCHARARVGEASDPEIGRGLHLDMANIPGGLDLNLQPEEEEDELNSPSHIDLNR